MALGDFSFCVYVLLGIKLFACIMPVTRGFFLFLTLQTERESLRLKDFSLNIQGLLMLGAANCLGCFSTSLE